jgi:8-oxo-dGTP pyrophosphatase MutT (NUDIX family)
MFDMNAGWTDREIPANIEAEQQLIGAILIDNSSLAVVAPIISGEHFFEEIHRRIFNATSKMILAGQEANPITLKPFLPGAEKVGQLTIQEYLIRLSAEAVAPRLIRGFARAIRELWEEAMVSAPLRYIGSGQAGDYMIHAYRAENVAAAPSAQNDPDQEVDRWEWLDLPLAADVLANLHAPRNVTLALMGLAPGAGLLLVPAGDRR